LWWGERGLPRALALIAVLALPACQVRPLYWTGSGGVSPQAVLPAISVEPPGDRFEQVYRNALLFGLRGGGEAANPRYTLIYRMTVNAQAVAVERGSATPNAYQVTGGVSFLLKDTATGESRFGASVSAVDSYARSSQDFANIRARRDAEDRIATTLAELTQARLAAYFATN
jgi:LPS-assembly lipoprotein